LILSEVLFQIAIFLNADLFAFLMSFDTTFLPSLGVNNTARVNTFSFAYAFKTNFFGLCLKRSLPWSSLLPRTAKLKSSQILYQLHGKSGGKQTAKLRRNG